MNTRKLVIEEGGFKYDSDSYADDLPYWTLDYGNKPHLIIPYTLSENDMRFVSPSGFSTGADFCQYLKETLKYLIAEAKATGSAKMMTIGLHCRLARPGRVSGLSDFIDFAKGYNVWFCTREQIADFWIENHYPHGAGKPVETVSSQQAENGVTASEKSEEEDAPVDSKELGVEEVTEEEGDII